MHFNRLFKNATRILMGVEYPQAIAKRRSRFQDVQRISWTFLGDVLYVLVEIVNSFRVPTYYHLRHVLKPH